MNLNTNTSVNLHPSEEIATSQLYAVVPESFGAQICWPGGNVSGGGVQVQALPVHKQHQK